MGLGPAAELVTDNVFFAHQPSITGTGAIHRSGASIGRAWFGASERCWRR
ncbi:MAG: hypothetical protein HY962_01215 [Ignavibacteriae bacterium]|nr:hypothetical protein [Ignavibacteriota bacterium]